MSRYALQGPSPSRRDLLFQRPGARAFERAMLRYFFDITDGETLRDDTGVELDSLADARAQAVIVLAGAIMPAETVKILHGQDWRVDVRGEAGAVLFTLEYRSGAAP